MITVKEFKKFFKLNKEHVYYKLYQNGKNTQYTPNINRLQQDDYLIDNIEIEELTNETVDNETITNVKIYLKATNTYSDYRFLLDYGYATVHPIKYMVELSLLNENVTDLTDEEINSLINYVFECYITYDDTMLEPLMTIVTNLYLADEPAFGNEKLTLEDLKQLNKMNKIADLYYKYY